MQKEGISTLKQARTQGLTIPRNPELMPEVSVEISRAISKLTGDVSRNKRDGDEPDHLYGLSVLEVPSRTRLRMTGPVLPSKREHWSEILGAPEKMTQVANVMSRQLKCGFVTMSVHYQNIYDAPHSICPHADHIDLVPISEALRRAPRILQEAGQESLGTNEMTLALAMRQCLYMPFNAFGM
jgi:hypothetical protein